MWETATEHIPTGRKLRLQESGSALSFRDLFRLLENDDEFTGWYTNLVADNEHEAFYWEHPPLTIENLDQDAEFVVVDAAMLARLRSDPAPFASQFDDQPQGDVITFPNLGGDALLIVPRPIVAIEAYPHLGAFLRLAPAAQIRSLWQQTARTVRDNLTAKPKWLSTAGLGVAWLHIRLDTRPKYYSYVPYTRYPQ